MGEALDYLNAAVPEVTGEACGAVLAALGEVQAKLAAAHAGFLRRFDAADAHNADGYGSSAAWLAAKTGMSRGGARMAVRRMRQIAGRPLLDAALAAGEITESLAFTVVDWTRKLPVGMRDEMDRIMLQAAAAGASLDDLATIAAYAIEKWRQQQPDPDEPGTPDRSGADPADPGSDAAAAAAGAQGLGGADPGDPDSGGRGFGGSASEPDDGFDDRFLKVAVTFGGAGVIRGDLTAECASAVRAVLEALGKRGGPEDHRTEAQRFHDGLQLACEMLLRARLVPDRAGADTQVIAHIPLSQLRSMPRAADLEDAWIRARAGEAGYLTGKSAETAACDAHTIPVVTGTLDDTVIDRMIDLARAASAGGADGRARGARAGSLPFETRRELRHTMARLAIDLVSGPAGIASALRRGLLDKPYNTPSLPLDIGRSHVIPGQIRRAVQLRDRGCAWPRCGRPAAHCDIHHLRHQRDGGETSLDNCSMLCQFHHDVCIHRNGWQFILNPDGTTEARSPDGAQVLYSHIPPSAQATGQAA